MRKLIEGEVRWEGALGVGRPRCVPSYVGGEKVRDRRSIGDGFIRDPPQRIDPSDADRDILAPQLVDSAREPVGELALPGELQLLAASRAAELGLRHVR